MIALLQTATERVGFDPAHINPWLQLFLVYGVIVASGVFGAWRWLMKPLRDEIAAVAAQFSKDLDGMGVRIADIATQSTTAIGRVEIMERAQALANQDCSGVHERAARMEERMENLIKTVGENEMKRLGELSDIKERMVRMETKLDMELRARKEDGPR